MQWTYELSLALWALVVLVAMVTELPLRIHMTLRGKGEWGQLWVIAAGVQVAGVTISYAAASEIDSVLQVHVFGLRVLRKSPVRFKKSEKKESAKERSLDDWMQEAKSLRARIERWIELDDLLSGALGLRSYVKVPRLEGMVGYATPDYATTGMLLGVLYSVAGLFVPLGRLQVEPIWEQRATVHGDMKLEVRLWPVRAIAYLLLFAAKNVNFRRRETKQVVVSS